MNSAIRDHLFKHQLIEDPFDYHILADDTLVNRYAFFDRTFQALYNRKAEQYKLKDCHFYLKNDRSYNAFASCKKGYNLIGITNGYVQIQDIFDVKKTSDFLFIALKNEMDISEAYANLWMEDLFNVHTFMVDCSIQFTFGHEFQHILQFNSSKIKKEQSCHENLVLSKFDILHHVREYDADRFASFEVLKYVFQFKNTLRNKSGNVYKCLLFLGLGSLFITKLLFYFGITNFNQTIRKQAFYTKAYSHPHPFVRIINIIDYYLEQIEQFHPDLKMSKQELLNNSLGIVGIYLNTILPGKNAPAELLDDLFLHIDEINDYNNELYDVAATNESIRDLLIARGIQFETDSSMKRKRF